MADGTVPMEWVIGADETTLWVWPQSPDPVTVRFPLRKWAKIERAAEVEHGGDVRAYVSRVLTASVEEHKEVLSDGSV